jgi:glycerophosphoryl diester phosphodiesterase
MNKWMVYGIVLGATVVAVSRLKTPGRAATTQPILVAHRGANRLADENTTDAYSRAVDFGMNYIECDPRLTSDGAFVIMHDNSVDRTTNGRGKIADMTLEKIKMLRTRRGAQVPTLDEVLDIALERGVNVYIDTKQNDIEYLKKLMRHIEAKGMSGRVIMGVWSVETQKWMQKHYPQVPTCLPYPTPVPILKTMKDIGVDWVGTLVPYATDALIAKAHSLGLKVITMPINDAETMNQKYVAGIDALQTDDPAMLDAFMRQAQQRQ